MRENPRVTNPDRLTGLDASFLALEDGGAHMHVGSVLLFDGEAPDYEDVAQIERRLALVPRYRQKLAFPPLVQSRPVWIDDPHFNPRYHVRHTALPEPAGEDELRRLAGPGLRPAAGPLQAAVGAVAGRPRRQRPVRARSPRRTTASSTGSRASTSRPCSSTSTPTRPRRPSRAVGAAARADAATLLADALAERAAAPLGLARAAAGAVTHPRERARGRRDGGRRAGRDRAGRAGRRAAVAAERADRPAPPLRLGRRRPATFKAIKNALGGTVNDVVLTVVTGALRSHFLAHGYDTDVELKAMVPVSVRADSERGALGNKVAAMYAPLPIGLDDPIARFRAIHEAMRGLKESGQAVGAEVLTALADFAPPTILSQAARLQAVQRFFNLTVTNVPGPQFPLLPARAAALADLPAVPWRELALGIAIMSYDGRIDFGLVPTTTRCPTSTASPPRSRRRSTSWRAAAGAARKPARPAARAPSSAAGRSPRSPSRSRRSTRASATSRATRAWCASRSPGRATPAPSWCCSPSWC